MKQLEESDGKGSVSKVGISLLLLSIIVLFSVLGIAYLSANKSPEIQLPSLFYFNCLILLISSVFLHYAWAGRHKIFAKKLLLAAIGLGIIFLISQSVAWGSLYGKGITLMSGQHASYLYLLTGLHAVHIIGGLSFLSFVFFTFEKRGRRYLESALYFWHFLGLLWIYLICLLLI